MCEPYDEVMADRGFTIAEDLILRHCKLHIPSGRRGREQFTKADRSQQDQENCKSENLCRASNQALEDLSIYQE